MKALDRFIKGDMHGIHYAVSIFFATAILWVLVHEMAEVNPIWAISSMVATSDPAMKQAMLILRARITNTLVGCAGWTGVHRHRRYEADHSASGHGSHSSPVVVCGARPNHVAAGADQCGVRHRRLTGVSLANTRLEGRRIPHGRGVVRLCRRNRGGVDCFFGVAAAGSRAC